MRTARSAIAGIGESAVGRVPGRSAQQLQYDATQAALSDSGLVIAQIDGLLTTPVRVERWAIPCAQVASNLGNSAFLSRDNRSRGRLWRRYDPTCRNGYLYRTLHDCTLRGRPGRFVTFNLRRVNPEHG